MRINAGSHFFPKTAAKIGRARKQRRKAIMAQVTFVPFPEEVIRHAKKTLEERRKARRSAPYVPECVDHAYGIEESEATSVVNIARRGLMAAEVTVRALDEGMLMLRYDCALDLAFWLEMLVDEKKKEISFIRGRTGGHSPGSFLVSGDPFEDRFRVTDKNNPGFVLSSPSVPECQANKAFDA